MNTSRILSIMLILCLSLMGAAIATAQDPTPTVPVKATPVPTEVAAEATAEATADAPLDDGDAIVETPIGDLSYHETVIGRIDNDGPSQDWPLPLASADRLQIRVERLDGNVLPNIILLDAGGQQVGTSNGTQPDGATAILDNVTVAAPGTYTVRIERQRGADGLTEGHYSLTVIPLASAADAAPNTDIIDDIEPGEPVEGTITAEHWQHRFSYSAPAADAIRVIAERTSGSLEPLVQVINSDGAVVATGYTETSGDVAFTNRVNLTAAGEYIIAVTRTQEFNGRTVGGYSLTLELIGSGEGSPNLAGTAGMVSYDTALDGEITPARWYEDWTLSAEAGDTISIRVDRLDVDDSGNLQPEVVLLGGSGQDIARGYTSNTGDSAAIEGRTLDGRGEYTVRVTRRQGQTGVTEGAYTLTVRLVGSGVGSAALDGTTGSIATGEQVAGEVTNTRWADSWSYNATAGERVTIQVERTSGTLIPRVQVRDRNGQVISNGYPDATQDTASLQFNPPSTGEFMIVVLRDREQQGVTSGSYTLRVNPVG